MRRPKRYPMWLEIPVGLVLVLLLGILLVLLFGILLEHLIPDVNHSAGPVLLSISAAIDPL